MMIGMMKMTDEKRMMAERPRVGEGGRSIPVLPDLVIDRRGCPYGLDDYLYT